MAAYPRLVIVALLAAFGFTVTACGGSSIDLSDRLIVIRADGIADLSLAGGDETLLVQKPDESLLIEPSLSPDGRTLAFVRQLIPIVIPGQDTELGMDIYFADRDGANQRLVLEHSELNEQVRAPVWLPDSQHLIVNVQRITGGRIVTSLELFEPATGERSVIVENGFRPDVSPDGSRILYVTQDENILQTLWVANVDGSEPIALAGPEDDFGSVISPRFSPDGSTIVFAASRLPAETIARPDTQKFVASRPGVVTAPQSGFVYNGLPADIWTIPAAGGEVRLLAPLQLDLPSIDWSNDGERIFAFAGKGLFVIDPEDGSDRRLGDGVFHGQMDWVGDEATQ